MKISRRVMPAQTTAALAAGLIAIPAVMAAGHPAASATATATATATAAPTARVPGLAIAITDGRVTARAGDMLTYTVSVRDSGTAPAPHLKITQTLSAGLEFLSASNHGVAGSGHVSWSTGLATGGTRTFHVVTRVTRTPATLLRLAAVACIARPGSPRPIVCAAHLDRLPAAAAESAPRSGGPGINPMTYTVAALAVLALGLVTVIVTRRRRWPRRRAA